MSFFAEHSEVVYSMGIALGMGLLVGAERERRKSRNIQPSSAGLRTFAIVSLLGAVSFWLGGVILTSATLAVVSIVTGLAYAQNAKEEPGLTTEVALLLTLLLGAATQKVPEIAASLSVILTVLLAAREQMHKFVKTMLSGNEANDALILAAATLIILPLMPDRLPWGYEAVNPQRIWLVVVLVMSISAAGHVASRLLGTQRGLPLAGFFSGFVSSTMTIGAMGGRVKAHPELHRPAVAGAILSTIASLVQISVIFGTLSPTLLRTMAPVLVWAIAAATVYGLIFTALSQKQKHVQKDFIENSHAFSLKTAFYFGAAITVILVIVDTMNEWYGEGGVMIATAIAGLADTHAASASIGSLVSAGKLEPAAAMIPLLLAMSVNTCSRIALTLLPGNRRFAAEVIPGLVLTNAAAWAGAFIGLPWLEFATARPAG